jgi:oxygen-independent coproporphyrinogen-3 oxidase
MERWQHNGRFAPPDPDLAADQYELAGQLLAAAGFIQYEISNWAQPGRECEHNLTYWRNGEYLGLGAGAHGHAAGTRYQVVKQPRVYIRRLSEPGDWRYPWSTAVASQRQLDRAEAMTDTVITQLRLLREGLDLAQFADKFGQSLASAFPDALPQLLEWGLLHEQNGRLLLTERGRFLSNQVFYRFM